MQQNTGISDVLHDFNNSKKKLGLDGWVASFYRTFQVSYWNIETCITGSCVCIALIFLT